MTTVGEFDSSPFGLEPFGGAYTGDDTEEPLSREWGVLLNGVYLSGGCGDGGQFNLGMVPDEIVTNYASNPSFETGFVNWHGGQNLNLYTTTDSAAGVEGARVGAVIPNGGGPPGGGGGSPWLMRLGNPGSNIGSNGGIPVVPGEVWSFSGRCRRAGSQVPGTVRLMLLGYDGTGSFVTTIAQTEVSTVAGSPATMNEGRLEGVTIPTGVSYVVLAWYTLPGADTSSWTAGSFYADAHMASKTPTVPDYFDGDTISLDPMETYEWDGTPNGSTSTHTSYVIAPIPIPGTEDPSGTLSAPPEGMGLPDLRTEDVTYPQRDGVRHFRDWYGPRIVTLEEVTVGGDDCPSCPSTRARVRDIVNAWSRQCDDVEMVIYTNCHGTDPDRGLVGPFGIVGRPRVAELEWARLSTPMATLTLRFDAVDHRLFILDADGTPGSGGQCVLLSPTMDLFCRSYPRCYPLCYDNDISPGSGGPTEVTVDGDLCVNPTVTLTGPLTTPTIENLTTGESLIYAATILAGQSVTINTQDGTAMTDDGQSRTYLLEGSIRLTIDTGVSTLQLRSYGSTDSGTAEVCWRPAVLSG